MADASDGATNGAGAAAVVAAAIGCLTLGLLALLADALPSVARPLDLWNPTGPLSGVSDAAIIVWLAAWLVLSRRWSRKAVDLARINWAALAMFALAALLTFPPAMDFLQAK